MSKDLIIELEVLLKEKKSELAHVRRQPVSSSQIVQEYFTDGIVLGIEKCLEIVKQSKINESFMGRDSNE